MNCLLTRTLAFASILLCSAIVVHPASAQAAATLPLGTVVTFAYGDLNQVLAGAERREMKALYDNLKAEQMTRAKPAS